jgi:bifunctional NMN adenylyltransferase/nudix hydrolase
MKQNAFVIGRFQHFHAGHANLINEAAKYAKNVTVLVGSCNASRSIKNPYSWEERIEVIKAEFPNVNVIPIYDYPYDDRLWVSQIRDIISDIPNSCIVGCNKDDSTYYMKIFGDDLEVINLPEFHADGGKVNATLIRELLFSGEEIPAKFSGGFRASSVLKEQYTTAIAPLIPEFNYIKRYKTSWSKAPFPPTFVTADSLVVHRSSFLAIKRKGMPGKGLFALPGGFIDSGEFIKQSALRELREETRFAIKNPHTKSKIPMMEEWMKGSEVFDHPNRSVRGRTITHAFTWLIPDKYDIDVTADDDADDVFWLPLSMLNDAMNARLFMEDHFHIIKHCISFCK